MLARPLLSAPEAAMLVDVGCGKPLSPSAFMSFLYFGYGSNMDATSLRAKGVQPSSSTPALLTGWRLRFNVEPFFRHEGGVGNRSAAGRADLDIDAEDTPEALCPRHVVPTSSRPGVRLV
jgi:hypothetical protein